MLTDWVLIRRLAQEISERLRGARVEDVGALGGGRVALVVRTHGARATLAIDPFASPPLVTLEETPAAGSEEAENVTVEAGFIATLARALRGMRLEGAWSRRGDRLVRLRFASRSRFGVGEQLDLYVELVPRFGNLVLAKGDIVVAARKEFAPADNARRAVQAGAPYALPPLPARPNLLAAEAHANDDAPAQPLYVYRRDGRLLQAYVTPLAEMEAAECTRESSLLEIFAELRAQQAALAGNERQRQRRGTILKRLDERERKLRGELSGLAEKRRRAEDRTALRSEGEHIFATLYGLDETQREAAKERAAELFARYKKLGKSLPHIETRERALRASLEAIETLRWEAERAGESDLGDVEAAAASLVPQRNAPARPPAPKRRRAPLALRTESGSRIVVGRSPLENAELTFRLARPNDLWFHARGIPGAHVILTRDDRRPAPDEDVQRAAEFAAFYSRAKSATSVPVDYTLRKHVRKQRDAPPGLVWYTHGRTIVAAPKSLDSFVAPSNRRKDPIV
jgi:predicted ribosome quality control (RQC) complex YloA/Tae2 family protein